MSCLLKITFPNSDETTGTFLLLQILTLSVYDEISSKSDVDGFHAIWRLIQTIIEIYAAFSEKEKKTGFMFTIFVL